jgi:hypothetical protein
MFEAIWAMNNAGKMHGWFAIVKAAIEPKWHWFAVNGEEDRRLFAFP